MFDNEEPSLPEVAKPRLPEVPGLEILDIIAIGGHGTVYKARQSQHDRVVALKVLDTKFMDADVRRRFDRERVALGRISDHPSIVSLLDSGYTEDGAPYLLLEFASGGSLQEHLVSGPMGLDEATALIIGLAAAAERVHNAGVIHCDIKPENILRSAYDEWMLTDFGIASLTDGLATGTVQASYAHAAPETFDGDAPTASADVYSLASVLATCLSGEQPFERAEEEAVVSVIRRVMVDPYPDLRRYGVEDDLASLLEMALSKEPTQRPVSAQAFAAALNGIREAHGLAPEQIRSGDVAVANATEIVAESDIEAAAASNWSGGGASVTETISEPKRRVRMLAAALCLALAVFGLSVTLPSGLSGSDGDQVAVAVAGDGDGLGTRGRNAVVIQGNIDAADELMDALDDAVEEADGDNNDADNDDADNDGDGPGNGNGPNNGPNNGDGDGDGPGNGNGPNNGPGNGNGPNNGDGDGDGPGNGNGDGPGNGNGGGNGNGPNNGGGNGAGNGPGAN